MKEEEIIEGNKLIAEFMGKKLRDQPLDQYRDAENLKYHSSWDWQIPVYKKVYKLYADRYGHTFQRTMEFAVRYDNQVRYGTTFTAFEELITAIKWYNSQKQEQESNR